MSFLSLPVEIRLKIYTHLFAPSTLLLTPDPRRETTCILPSASKLQNPTHRSSQILATCRAILFEARPILYASTSFHIITAQAFCGRYPRTLTDGHIASPYVQHLVWQLDCDMMKHFYPEDMRLDADSFAEVESLELRVRAETWRNSFLGEWCDREAFVKGREQAIEYAKVLKGMMVGSARGASGDGVEKEVCLVEDRSQLGRGRVVLRLCRSEGRLRSEQEVLLT